MENQPIKLGEVEIPECGSVPVYLVDENSVTAISFKPKYKDPNEGRIIYMNHETGKCTYEDGTPFMVVGSEYTVGFVMTRCKTIEEFTEKELQLVINRVKERLNKKPERVICAAIWYKDLPFDRKPFGDSEIHPGLVYPRNVDRGVVFCGHRHPHCLYAMVVLYKLKQHQAGEEVQGFLTSRNRFVDREEGLRIALASNQLEHPEKVRGDELYSEDLY